MSETSSIREPSIHEVFVKFNLSSSSEEPPRKEWSSLASLPVEDSPKMVLFKQGLYKPGSGEICAKYITLSDSSVLTHPYYNYPSVVDPGIMEALLKPGKYYGVNPRGVRAMCLALSFNSNVTRLDLTSNFLDDDSCYHLGQLLGENMALQELVLSGCRLNLSCNDLGMESALSFAEVLEVNNKITHLDLSWNKFSTIKGPNELLDKLSESKVLVELNMAWNGLKVTNVFTKLLNVPTLRILDLSNNRLSDTAAKFIANSLFKAKRLHTLDLSYNPLDPESALKILESLRKPNVKLSNLFMEQIVVDEEFFKVLNEILSLRFRKNTKVTHGEVLHNYTLSVPDLRIIVMKRFDYLTQKGKKNKLDIALYFLQLRKSVDIVQPREILRDLKIAGTPVEEDLVNQLTELFPGPPLDKGVKTIKLDGIIEMIKRLWPEKKLPPTPPPEPEPVVEKNDKEGKGKKK
ncbi:unnamed protein product [Leptosia nina]|uniref:Uncharacterized protein n=1 Tax=Leptosia nina TaxID=320188 RepID=A0AAV1JVS3_9NEOP